jgi:hypothetical protein
MGAGSIPVSKVWGYLDRFNLPDWWEPVLLQADASIVSDSRKDSSNGSRSSRQRQTS